MYTKAEKGASITIKNLDPRTILYEVSKFVAVPNSFFAVQRNGSG
jgi:hypothetical protein